MPTYEYVCKECGKHLEIVQSFDEPSLTTCPSCQGRLRKVFGSIGISFKGSGFYKTDSRSQGTSRPSRDASSPAASNGDGAAASTSKEPASKPSGEAGSTPAAGGGEKAGKKEQAAPSTTKPTAAKAS